MKPDHNMSSLEQRLRDANRITAEEIVPGDIVALGHWHGVVGGTLLLLVLSTSLVNKGKLGLCVEVMALGKGDISQWIWHSGQWITVHRQPDDRERVTRAFTHKTIRSG